MEAFRAARGVGPGEGRGAAPGGAALRGAGACGDARSSQTARDGDRLDRNAARRLRLLLDGRDQPGTRLEQFEGGVQAASVADQFPLRRCRRQSRLAGDRLRAPAQEGRRADAGARRRALRLDRLSRFPRAAERIQPEEGVVRLRQPEQPAGRMAARPDPGVLLPRPLSLRAGRRCAGGAAQAHDRGQLGLAARHAVNAGEAVPGAVAETAVSGCGGGGADAGRLGRAARCGERGGGVVRDRLARSGQAHAGGDRA